MRFHVLGLSHTQTTAEYSVCAFTQKVRHLCRMLHGLGHHVMHYGTAGSDPVCSENVEVLDAETFHRVHHAYDYRTDGWRIDRENDAYKTFTANAIAAIGQRAQPGDFLLCTFGLDHQPIAEALTSLISVESGIGYPHTFARWRVFESYAWMHFHYGKEGRDVSPPWYDAVIPNAFDVADFPFQPYKDHYHIFLGRPNHLKGRDIAIKACKEIGVRLCVAGQGSREVPSGVTHLGVLGPEERARWVGRAAALWCPTYYVEPFGGVAVEAALCGTPVICTDVGAFTETVVHGVTGYRCRTYEQFVWAARHTGTISTNACRDWALSRYSLGRVALMYDEYFQMLARLYDSPDGWYAANPGRRQLNWLQGF